MSYPPLRPVAAVMPRPAATTLILRDGPMGLEVLMVRRSLQASFMPGAYVFPGGAVDADDGVAAALAAIDEPAELLVRRIGAVTGVGELAVGYAVAALRECFEECGLWLGAEAPGGAEPDWTAMRARCHAGQSLSAVAAAAGLRLATSALQPWSHWVTPVGVYKRFDTLFFAVRAPAAQVPTPDVGETITLSWVNPPTALAEHDGGRFPMEFATVATVESLLPFAGQPVQALLDCAAAQTTLPPVHPRLILDAGGGIAGVLLPGQPGYEQAHGA